MSNKKFTVHLDTKRFTSKPVLASEINNRIINKEVSIDAESLAYALTSGQTFVACRLGENELGEKTRSESSWKSQEIICLDFDKGMKLEQAIEEFKDIAMFIYTTFSHTDKDNKFRVVFRLNRIVEKSYEIKYLYQHMLNKYKDADQACKDGSRMFYGGSKLHKLNYDNRLDVDEALRLWCVHVDLDLNYYTANVDTDKFTLKNEEHLDKIRIMDVNYMRKHLSISENKKIFFTHDEFYSYIKNQDLNKFLGVGYKHFQCIFHKDDSPSANIFTVTNNGNQLYKCFSSNCPCKVGTIFKCIEMITGMSKVKVIKFLKNVYNIEMGETDWQKDQKEIIESNIRYIGGEDFPVEYPTQYKLIKPYLENMITFLNVAKDNIPPQHYTEDQMLPIFYTTMRTFTRICGYEESNTKRIKDRLAIFAYLCYITKLSEEQIPDKLLKSAKFKALEGKNAIGSKAYNLKSFFEISSFDSTTLEMAEAKAEEFYENKLTVRAWSYELLYRTFGKEEADRVYPQLSKTVISEQSNDHSKIIEQAIMNDIETRGWTIEKDLITDINLKWGGKNYKERQWKMVLQEIIDKYGLKRSRMSKDLKYRFKVEDIKGTPFILYK